MPQGSIIDGVFTLKDGTKIVGAEVKNGRLTGMFFESQAMEIVTLPSLKNTQAMRSIARGTQSYLAAGVTTADSAGRGAGIFPTDLPKFQQALENGDLGIRVILHPFTGSMAESVGLPGSLNHRVLKWNTNGTTSYVDDSPTTDSPAVGDDLTGWNRAADGTALPENYLLFGAWKQVYDGSNQGYTGYFKHPGYWNKADNAPNDPATGKPDPNAPQELLGLNGTIVLPRAVMWESVDFYHKHGQPLETHTNGSWAAEDYMTALELAVANHPEIKDMRHTFIHGQMEERQVVERATGKYDELDSTAGMYEDLSGTARQSGTDIDVYGKAWTASDLRAALKNGQLVNDQNLVTSYFINHTYFWGDRHLGIYMGPGRGKQQNPCGWAAAYGHNFTTHNDTDVTPIAPLRSLQSSVTRTSTGGQLLSGSSNDLGAKAVYPETKGGTEREFWDFDQRINALQALHSTTVNSAYQNHVEHLVGSLEEGKLADFVILDTDPLQVAEKSPMTLASMRVAATIVSDTVVHGLLPDSATMISQFRASYDQPSVESVVTIRDSAYLDDATVEKDYAPLGDGEKRFGTVLFTADASAGSSVVFQMSLLGNGESLSNLKLYKMAANQKTEYVYGRPDADVISSASGQWWVADFAYPTTQLAQDAVLEMDKQYIAFFIIRDNDVIFDADKTDGVIVDPVTLVTTTGTMPSNGNSSETAGVPSEQGSGGSSGCTVGATPSYDLMVLFLGVMAVAAVRVVRRKASEEKIER